MNYNDYSEIFKYIMTYDLYKVKKNINNFKKYESIFNVSDESNMISTGEDNNNNGLIENIFIFYCLAKYGFIFADKAYPYDKWVEVINNPKTQDESLRILIHFAWIASKLYLNEDLKFKMPVAGGDGDNGDDIDNELQNELQNEEIKNEDGHRKYILYLYDNRVLYKKYLSKFYEIIKDKELIKTLHKFLDELTHKTIQNIYMQEHISLYSTWSDDEKEENGYYRIEYPNGSYENVNIKYEETNDNGVKHKKKTVSREYKNKADNISAVGRMVTNGSTQTEDKKENRIVVKPNDPRVQTDPSSKIGRNYNILKYYVDKVNYSSIAHDIHYEQLAKKEKSDLDELSETRNIVFYELRDEVEPGKQKISQLEKPLNNSLQSNLAPNITLQRYFNDLNNDLNNNLNNNSTDIDNFIDKLKNFNTILLSPAILGNQIVDNNSTTLIQKLQEYNKTFNNNNDPIANLYLITTLITGVINNSKIINNTNDTIVNNISINSLISLLNKVYSNQRIIANTISYMDTITETNNELIIKFKNLLHKPPNGPITTSNKQKNLQLISLNT